ncbi:MAG: COX15/CtaA family protein, partial [Halolamina sp.]
VTMNRPSYRQFALFATALTGTLVALGVYTAATGSGLACSQQWPLCDNGLLPRTLPSFIEWFHRLVAMVTGFVIIGAAGAAWVGDQSRRTAVLATTALVLLPLQVSLGAVTVTLNGALPWGYSVPTQAAHLLVALSIFTALTLATLSAMRGHYRRSAVERVRLALFAVLALLPVNAVFGRVTPLVDYSPAAQALFTLTALLTFAALLAGAVWLPTGMARYRPALSIALVSVFLVTLLGRDLVAYDWTAHLVNWLLYGVAVLAAAAVAYAAQTARRDGRSAPA